MRAVQHQVRDPGDQEHDGAEGLEVEAARGGGVGGLEGLGQAGLLEVGEVSDQGYEQGDEAEAGEGGCGRPAPAQGGPAAMGTARAPSRTRP